MKTASATAATILAIGTGSMQLFRYNYTFGKRPGLFFARVTGLSALLTPGIAKDSLYVTHMAPGNLLLVISKVDLANSR